MKLWLFAMLFALGACAAMPQSDARAAIEIASRTCADAFGQQPDFAIPNWHVGVTGTEWVAWAGKGDRSDCDYIVQISMTDRSVGLGCLVCSFDVP
jgi:hypothetical protein